MDNSTLNSKVRLAIYILAGVVNLLTIYFATIGTLGAAEVTLVNGLNVFICGLAGFNVPTKSDK